MKRRDGQQEFRNAASRDPAVLEREADAARDDLRRTLERLDQQFSRGQMIDRMLQRWRERDSQVATNLARTVQANPAPVVLSSVGIGWLAFADTRQKHRPPSGGGYPMPLQCPRYVLANQRVGMLRTGLEGGRHRRRGGRVAQRHGDIAQTQGMPDPAHG